MEANLGNLRSSVSIEQASAVVDGLCMLRETKRCRFGWPRSHGRGGYAGQLPNSKQGLAAMEMTPKEAKSVEVFAALVNDVSGLN